MNTKLYITGIKVLCVAAVLGTTTEATAQKDGSKDKNVTREMTLEREYDPSVQDASKVNTLPLVKEPKIRKMPISYSTFALPVEPDKELSLLSSGKVMTDMNFNKRRGYLNLGGGNYMNLNGDLGYHILSTEKDFLGAYFSHRSTNGKVKYLQDDAKQKAKLNDNLGAINYKHEFEKLSLKLAGQYGYTAFNYYGFPGFSPMSTPGMSPMDNQVNQQIYFKAGIASKEAPAFNYLLDIDYRNFSQKYGEGPGLDGAKENNIGLALDLNAGFNGNNKIGLGVLADYYGYGLPEEFGRQFDNFNNYAEITLSPYYAIDGDSWNVKLGANVMFISGDDHKLFASPNIKASITVADATVIYGNFLGEIGSNSMYQVALDNRYVDPMYRIKPSRTWLDGTIGIKSGVAPGFWFDVFAGYKITDNEHFYYADLNTNNRDTRWGNIFAPAYMNAKLFRIGANLKYSYQQFLDFSLKGVYNSWKVSDSDYSIVGGTNPTERAYNKPKMEIDAAIDVKPMDKLTLSLNYYLGAGRYAVANLDDVKMKNINELSLKGTYTFNDTFGVYAKLNNLMFQKYDLYYGYTAQGFNAMIGLNLNF